MDQADWFELLQEDIKPVARLLAERIHQGMAQELIRGMSDATTETIDEGVEIDEDFAVDVLLPAMKREFFVTMARLCNQSADGWLEVYRLGCKERWPK